MTDEATAGTCEVERDGDDAIVRAGGAWVLDNLIELQRQVDRLSLPDRGSVRIDAGDVSRLDTAGVDLLRVLRDRARRDDRDVPVDGLADEYLALLELVDERMVPLEEVPQPERPGLVERVGRTTVAWAQDLLALVAFIGEASIAVLRQVRRPSRIRFRQTMKIVQDSGLDALPIVGLLVFLLGVVVAYQGGRQLEIYGANIFIVEMVGLIMLRELAPLIAAIIVAGRTGSAYAAEIGTMRVTEEIDALETIGIGPFDQLVLPKVFGLMLALPLLVVFGDIMGIVGGIVMAQVVLDVSYADFIQRMPTAISTSDFVVGVAKAPVFALIISMVGCHQGFQVTGGADSVGKQTTVSVVQSIFLVIISDAAFSILFSWMGV